jgi:hypothetical protein
VFACRAHRVLNFLQRDLPLFEEDDEDFELGGGGQTGAGGEAGMYSLYIWRVHVQCVVAVMTLCRLYCGTLPSMLLFARMVWYLRWNAFHGFVCDGYG